MSDPFSHWIVLLVTVCFFMAIIMVALWEKRRIQTYAIPAAGTEQPLTDYGRRTNAAAQQLAYVHRGIFHDARGGIYKTRSDFWTSPDNVVLALVSCGTIAKLPNGRVSLYSQLDGGRYLQTTDMTGENDLSGLTDLQIWPQLSFAKLVERHFARLQHLGCSPAPFSDSPMREVLTIRLRRTEKLVAQGDARFVDDDQTVWKFTLKGVRFYFVTVWLQRFRRGLRKIGLS